VQGLVRLGLPRAAESAAVADANYLVVVCPARVNLFPFSPGGRGASEVHLRGTNGDSPACQSRGEISINAFTHRQVVIGVWGARSEIIDGN
jgi:hypothetical protein